MPGTIDDTYDLCSAFLSVARTSLEITDAGAPDRYYVAPGPPALDCCDQLTVHSGMLNESATTLVPGPMGESMRVVTAAQLALGVVVTITRCVETITKGNLPSMLDLDANGKTVNQDLWALWNDISDALRDGTLAERCRGTWRQPAQPLGPSGGCAGWVLSYLVPINGAPELGGS